ncbi:MAG TPA: GNAT family protein, partial [Allosphingosinicella sp.]|nr:GNAT family protein [Allosphingosinicella sp.]
IDWTFDELGWVDVIHCIDPENRGSEQVAERLGSAKRGPGRLPPPFEQYKVEIWGQSQEEWRARRRA